MFGELLGEVLNRTPGAVAVTLMGFDGIAVETSESAEHAAAAQKHQNASIEFGQITAQLKGICEGMGTGDVRELTVRTGELTTVLTPITAEYFVALSMANGANVGKGRYLLRVTAPKLAKELG